MKFLRIISILLVAIAIWGGPSLALDWRSLHKQADALSLKQAITLVNSSPQSIENLYLLGLVYLNAYKTEDAKQAFKQMLRLEPKSVEARWGIAEVFRREHDYKKSKEFLDAVFSYNPKFSPAYVTLAYINYINMDFEETVRLTGKVINQGQENVDPTNFLRAHGLYAAAKGMIAHYGGPFSKAVNGAAVLKHLTIIRNIAPDSPVVNFGLGSYYMLIPSILGQDYGKAKTYLEKALQEDPLFPDIYVRLAQIYRVKGDTEKYEAYLQKALELDPKNELALDIKSRTCKFICITEK